MLLHVKMNNSDKEKIFREFFCLKWFSSTVQAIMPLFLNINKDGREKIVREFWLRNIVHLQFKYTESIIPFVTISL